MGNLRKIRKAINPKDKIMPIVFVPDKFDIKDLSGTDCIVITDSKVYERIKEGVENRMEKEK